MTHATPNMMLKNSNSSKNTLKSLEKIIKMTCCDNKIGRILIKNLPKTLICHLKRFKYDDRLNRMIKLFWKVAFPLEIKIAPVQILIFFLHCNYIFKEL